MGSWRRVAFVHFTVEGLQVCRGGVGRWAINLLEMLPRLRLAWLDRGVLITPYIAEPHLPAATPGYNAKRLAAARELLTSLGGDVCLLSDSQRGEGNCREADLSSLATVATQVVLGLAEQHDVVFSLSGESAFARLPVSVDHQLGDSQEDVRLVHTHGAAIPEGPFDIDPVELAGDATLAAWTHRSARVRIAYISRFMRDVFTQQYAVREDRLLSNISGISLSDPAFGPASRQHEAGILASRGIPDDRPLAITWGRNRRSNLDKGHDLLIRAAGLMDEAVVAVVATRDPDPELARLAAEVAPSTVVLDDEPFETIAAVLRAPNTIAACFLSATEHGAVTPFEAGWVAGPGCVLLAVPTGSFPELVTDGFTGVIAERSPEGVARGLRRVLDLKDEDRHRMQQAAAEQVRLHHDQERNVSELFEAVLGDLAT